MLNITFDPHGDVKLVLSTSGGLGTSPTAAQFLVNSGVLCLASPVFRAMLGANSCFKERKDLAANSQNSNNPPLEVRLSDDNPEGLAIILRIIHLHYQWIPSYKNICQSRLYQIAIICDKYEMKHAILYWFRQWSRSLQEDTSSWSGEEACKWLYIAYAFGDDSLFMKLSRELILHTKIDPSGGLTLPLLEFVPQAVIDEIQAMRQKAVDSMIGMIYVQIHQYSNPQHIQCAFKDPLCDATILGLLIRALHGIKLDVYAITAADTTEPRSITELKELLDQITFPDFLIQHDGSPTAGPEDYYSPFISTLSHYHQCSSCRNLFPSPPKKNTQGVKHTEKCSPLPKLKENLDKIWQSIQGLDYSRFIGGANKNHFAGTGSGDLWNTVCLKD